MTAGTAKSDYDNDSEAETADATVTAKENCWVNAPSPIVFKDVHLRLKHLPRTSVGAAPSIERSSYRPQHSASHRSHCVVKLHKLCKNEDGSDEFNLDLSTETSIFGFHLGETHGYSQTSTWNLALEPWVPPPASNRVDVAPWITEAVLALEIGAAAEFEISGLGHDGNQYWQVNLIEARPAYDILGDGGVVVCVLDRPSSGGEKPRDLAHVLASWRVWFMRNGELVLSTAPDSNSTFSRDTGKEFVIDEGKIMVALELGLKEMEAGSRAVLRVSEAWGLGSLMPEGSPCLHNAAVWVEIALHQVKNEPTPGEHESITAALEFALDKKKQGNECLAAKDIGRAVRRYEVGIRLLTTLLPGGTVSSGSGGSQQKTVSRAEASSPARTVAKDAELPGIIEALTALQLNAAQAEIKSSHWKNAIAFCDSVLQRDADCTKALYRRGFARVELGDFSSAIEDLRRAASTDSADVGIRRELARVEALQREHRKKEKNTFGGVFEKMRKEEVEEEEAQRKNEEIRQKAEQEECTKRRAEEIAKQRQKAEAEAKANTEPPAPPSTAADADAVGKMLSAAADAPDMNVEGEVQEALSPVLESSPPCVGDPNPVSEQGQHVPNSLDTNTTAIPTMPANLESRTVEKPPPVEYQVPAFLQRNKSKKTRA